MSTHNRFSGPDDDWQMNACINYSHDDWSLYALGYKEAADVLVEHISNSHRHQDMLVYPLIFLYRHYLELRLKGLILRSGSVLPQRVSYRKTHSLRELWKLCRSLLKRIEPGVSDDDLEPVECVIAAVCDMDPSSQGFRYPTLTDDSSALPADLTHINLREVHDMMEDAANFLDAVDTALNVRFDQICDMLAALGSDLESSQMEDYRDDDWS